MTRGSFGLVTASAVLVAALGSAEARRVDVLMIRARQPGAAPAGEVVLGTVRLFRRVLADGKPLAAGTYQVRLTSQAAQPAARGASNELERWVEFIQGGQVKGREVATVVPKDAVSQVAKGRPPAPGTSRVELLKGDEYLRVWINRAGTHYLIHLPVG